MSVVPSPEGLVPPPPGTEGETIDVVDNPEVPARSQWELFRRRFMRHKLALLSIVILVALFVMCFGASWIAPFHRNQQDILLGPTAPGGKHWFGTDQLGRDTFTELLYAGQVSLKIGLTVALLATALGTVVGACAGYFGGLIDQLLMRATDLFLVVPQIAILAVALRRFGQTENIIIFVLAALGWMYIARVVRGQVLSIKEKEFVEAAKASGASSARVIVRHILPNCMGPIVVNATLGIATAIVTESTLSFLGFGVQPPASSWGNMLSAAEGNYNQNTHLLYFPGLAILLTVLAVNFLGDGLRDALDPRSRH